jgi:hypothetical protein
MITAADGVYSVEGVLMEGVGDANLEVDFGNVGCRDGTEY